MVKKGLATLVILLFLGLAVSPSIYADNKMSLDPVPDLDCSGILDLSDSEPGDIISGTIVIENVGEPESLLNWELESYPEWGTWTFNPVCGYNLTPEYGVFEVVVEVILPDELEDEIEDSIKFVNLDDSEDYCCIDVYRKKAIVYDEYTPIQLVFLLINKLRYYEGIESEEDVLEIIEGDAELSGIVEELKSYGCGCEEDTTDWGYPVICTILLFNTIVTFGTLVFTRISFPFMLTLAVVNALECYWYKPYWNLI